MVRGGCHQAFSEVIIVSQNRREKFPSTSSKFLDKKASGFEDSLEDKWLCFIYSPLGLFQILLTRFPLTLGRWTEKGNRQNIVDKSSYLFEDKKTSIQRVGARVEGQKETFPPIICSYPSVSRSSQSIRHSYPEQTMFQRNLLLLKVREREANFILYWRMVYFGRQDILDSFVVAPDAANVLEENGGDCLVITEEPPPIRKCETIQAE